MSRNKLTRLGRIPDGWGARKLRDGAKIGSGKSPIYTSENIGVVDVIGSNGKIGSTDKVNFQSGIAVGRVGASGSVHYIKSPVWLSDNVLFVKPDPTIWNESFLYHALTRARLPALASRTAQPLLTQSDLGAIVLPVPSMNQQIRIALQLDSYNKTIERTEDVISKAEQLRDSIAYNVLTLGLPRHHTKWKKVPGLGTIPATWEVIPLGDLASIGAGDPAPQGAQYFERGKYPFIRTQDVGRAGRSRRFCNTKDKINDEAIIQNRLHLWPKGTTLIPKSGASTLLNHRVCLSQPGYVSSHLATIVPNDNVSDLFLYYKLCQLDARRLLRNPGYPSLSLSDLKSVKLSVPSLTTQMEIARILSDNDKAIERTKTSLFEANKLREVLQNKLLSHRGSGDHTEWIEATNINTTPDIGRRIK